MQLENNKFVQDANLEAYKESNELYELFAIFDIDSVFKKNKWHLQRKLFKLITSEKMMIRRGQFLLSGYFVFLFLHDEFLK